MIARGAIGQAAVQAAGQEEDARALQRQAIAAISGKDMRRPRADGAAA